MRRMSPCRLLRDMKLVHETTHDKFFSLIGDNLGVPRNKFLSFCRSFSEVNDNFTWGCSLKLDRFAPDHLKVLWDAGCRSMFIGVESSSQETLDKVNKAARVDNEVSGLFCAIEMGFKVETSFIIGFPWETESEIRSTYDLHCSLLKAGAARSQVGILCPIPGTDIVKDGDIAFDGLTSYVTQDDVCLSAEHGMLVDEHPLLFSHFGRYDTPNIRRPVLKAYAEAATRVAQLHLRQRRLNAEMNASNHGRSAT